MDGQGRAAPHPAGCARHQRKARHRRHARRRADAGAGSRASACPLDARLRGARGDERAARRPLHQPDQPEPPRGQGLHLRAFRRSRSGRTPGPFFVGAGVRTDATAPSVTEIYNEIRKMKDVEVTMDELRSAGQPRPLDARPLRDDRAGRGQLLRRCSSTTSGSTTTRSTSSGSAQSTRPRADRRPQAPRARADAGRRRRRSPEDRSGPDEAESRAGEVRDGEGNVVKP